MLALVPLRSKSIGRTDNQFLAIDRERLGRFEPCLESLLRQILPCTLQQSTPGFLCGERHVVCRCGKLAGERSYARICEMATLCRCLALSSDLGYVYRPLTQWDVKRGDRVRDVAREPYEPDTAHPSRFEYWSSHGQAHLSSPQQASCEDARVSRSHGNQVGQGNSGASPQEGTQASHGPASQQVRRRLIGPPSRGPFPASGG